MQAKFVQEGVSVDHTPESPVAAGQVVPLEKYVAVASRPIPANTLGALVTRGVFDVVKEAAVEVDAGAGVYWDESGGDGTGAATTERAGNIYMGSALADAGADDETVRILLRAQEEAAAETLALADLTDVGVIGHVAGRALVSDGAAMQAVAISGNATLAANGAVVVVGAAIGDSKEVTFGSSKLVRSGNNIIVTLPTSKPAGVAGALYVDGGVVKVADGT